MRPNRKGNWGASIAMTKKNTKNRDHGRLLLLCEKARSGRGSRDRLVWSTRTPGGLSIPKTRPEDMKGGYKACRSTRAFGQIAEFHPITFATHVNHRGPGCSKESFRKFRYPTGVDSLAASRCRAPILRRVYPGASPMPEHQTATMSRTMNNDLSFATNVRP